MPFTEIDSREKAMVNSHSAAISEDTADVTHLPPYANCAAQLLCVCPHNHSPYLLQKHSTTLASSSASHAVGFDVQHKNAPDPVLLRNELLQNIVDQSQILP
jgi:hypothetical protein